MFNAEAIRQIIRISLQPLTASRHPLYSPAAEEILIMIAAHESGFGRDLQQIGGGPALGLYQVEMRTLYDNYNNFLDARKQLARQIEDISGANGPSAKQLQYNPIYSTIHARLKLYRSPGALPDAGDTAAMASYCKQHYNSPGGSATVDKYLYDYFRLVEAA
ncbi:MAG TPA: hypothetical protein DCZ63_15270 [Geobacter sp.]|nr:hypothetical protein [Geobacter sp.]